MGERGSRLDVEMKKPIHLGSWSLFCDLAGRVQETLDNSVITIAAVGVPREVVRTLRTKIRRLFPGDRAKWKYGRLAGLETAAVVIEEQRLLHLAVYQMHVANATLWGRYFQQGKDFIRDAAANLPKPLSYLEPSMTLRMRLLGGTLATLIGRLLRARYRDDAKAFTVALEIVVDTDFRDAETEDQFRGSFFDWARTSRLITELGVRPSVSAVRCETEQQEPLLLLPDYIAGVYHHADPRTVLGEPVISTEEASRAVMDLRKRLSPRLYENSVEFDEEYPLDHRDGQVAQRGEKGPEAPA